jgi:hypothetical protein
MAGNESPLGSKARKLPINWLSAGCLCLVVLGSAAIYTAVFLVDHLDQSATERYTRSLGAGAAAAVPPGSDQKTAELWLDSQGMRVSELGPDVRDTGAEHHGMPPAQLGGVLRGATEQRLYYGHNEVSVYFFLDKQGKVIKHRVYQFHIGL